MVSFSSSCLLQVIKGCSVGQFERGAAFGRFDCDYRDVCSRIDRLIVDGYARRDEANQQMLLYVPDPNIGKEEEEEEEEEEVGRRKGTKFKSAV